jgi:hypothetical protein
MTVSSVSTYVFALLAVVAGTAALAAAALSTVMVL